MPTGSDLYRVPELTGEQTSGQPTTPQERYQQAVKAVDGLKQAFKPLDCGAEIDALYELEEAAGDPVHKALVSKAVGLAMSVIAKHEREILQYQQAVDRLGQAFKQYTVKRSLYGPRPRF